MIKIIQNYWKTILWSLVILVISATPGNRIPDIPIWNIDKFVHSFVYFILSFLFYWEYRKCSSIKTNKVLFLFAIFIIYGGVIEILQANVFVNRSGDILDFLANSLGVIIMLLIFFLIPKKRLNP